MKLEDVGAGVGVRINIKPSPSPSLTLTHPPTPIEDWRVLEYDLPNKFIW
jgi:hypothetical protein